MKKAEKRVEYVVPVVLLTLADVYVWAANAEAAHELAKRGDWHSITRMADAGQAVIGEPVERS